MEIRLRWGAFSLDLVLRDCGKVSFCIELCWYQRVKHWSELQLVCHNMMLMLCMSFENSHYASLDSFSKSKI